MYSGLDQAIAKAALAGGDFAAGESWL